MPEYIESPLNKRKRVVPAVMENNPPSKIKLPSFFYSSSERSRYKKEQKDKIEKANSIAKDNEKFESKISELEFKLKKALGPTARIKREK